MYVVTNIQKVVFKGGKNIQKVVYNIQKVVFLVFSLFTIICYSVFYKRFFKS
jgi:hypothetical protein